MSRQSKKRKSAVKPAENTEPVAATETEPDRSPPTSSPSQSTGEGDTMKKEAAKALYEDPRARPPFESDDLPVPKEAPPSFDPAERYEFKAHNPLEPETQEEYDLLMAAAARAKASMEQALRGDVIGYCASRSKKGFWRCKRHWQREPQPIHANEFTAEQLETLRNEPNLKLT